MDMIAQSLEHVAGYRRKCRSFRFFTLSAIAVRNRDALSKNGKNIPRYRRYFISVKTVLHHSKRKELMTDNS